LAEYRRVFPERVELTDEQETRRESLAAEYDQLADSPEADENDPATIERLSVIEQTLDELDAAQQCWSAETLAVAGAIVTVTYGGAAGVERGLIRRGNEPEVTRGDADKKPREPAGISAALVEDLTAQKTAALRVALADRPDIALAAVVHAMTLQALYPYSTDQSCLQMTVRGSYPERVIAEPDTIKALHIDANAEVRWASSLPEAAEGLWPWCLAQSQDMLLALLAFVAGRAVNAVRRKTDRPDNPRFVHVDALARSLALDMSAWFTADAASYFGRVSSAQIIAALCEAKGVAAAPSWTKMKKADLAAFAARELAGTGWLPAALRLNDAEAVPAEAA
jgi:ParB family chromosome partitioning protein